MFYLAGQINLNDLIIKGLAVVLPEFVQHFGRNFYGGCMAS